MLLRAVLAAAAALVAAVAAQEARCGRQAGNIACANSQCCSYLGATNGFAATSLVGQALTAVDPRCGRQGGGAVCPKGLCCSSLGGASGGGSNARCGPQGGNASCGNGLCCSFLGFCGQTEVHCGLQCQLLFGRCGLGPLPPPAPVGSFPTPDPAKAARYITGCNKGGVFALTFDDGPSVNIGLILDILKRNNIKATFFINGKNRGDLNVAKDKANLKRAFDEGHQIGSHTLSHIDISTTNETLLFPQMKVNDDLIKAVIGKRPVYMRPPFGSVNQRALTALGTWGYKVIGWNLDSKDFEHIGKPDFIQLGEDNYQADLLRISAVLPKTSLMTLQHDYVPEDSQAGGWVQHVIDKFKNLGYKFVTAGECLGDSPANWYRD
ncbi:hypothetical protein HK105_205203 [Polyrhizophydium stewartii]|uniref:Chitooligosaccharide deacetylase n=1 Tax=Polyrhizophydium stewartii TaxID=2732419 RepID=A0ABR4N717_9FUNG